MQRIIFIFSLSLFIFSSSSFAQWWVQGGNLLWPYGDINIKYNLKAGSAIEESAWANLFPDDIPVSAHRFYSSQESWWGGSAFVNIASGNHKIINNNSRINGIDNQVVQITDTLVSQLGIQTSLHIDSQDSTANWKSSFASITNFEASLSLGDLPKGLDNWSSISLYNAYIDEWQVDAAVDTIPFNKTYGYSFRLGDGNKLRYPNLYSFYSDLTSYNASTKIINGFHFYGIGDYPSYFGGRVEAKDFKLLALNSAPVTSSDIGTIGEIKVDANYIYICVATNTWKRASLSTW